uniref:Vitellogenin domain-containing protein n=1 Tax=Anguilla anguilla TaxID=7936 RepID=A0A0E9R0M4_ANGAN
MTFFINNNVIVCASEYLLQISELIQCLAQANINQVDSASSADVLHLYQLLRVATQDNLEALWKQFSGNAEYR